MGDKHLTENSGLLNHLLSGGTIRADRGSDIQESVSIYCARVTMPASANIDKATKCMYSLIQCWHTPITESVGWVAPSIEYFWQMNPNIGNPSCLFHFNASKFVLLLCDSVVPFG